MKPMLYDRLNPGMRETVDAFAARIRDLPWAAKSDLLFEAVKPFADEFGSEAARLASQGFLTAVMERLGPEEVSDPHQACLLARSLNPEHRVMADRYLTDRARGARRWESGVVGEPPEELVN